MAGKVENTTTKTPPAPPGLMTLIEQCHKIYPDQPNPLQVTTLLKYWLGGQDPLDYISMYYNKGDESLGIPPHWHYISFGLSDLHGDERVHIKDSSAVLLKEKEKISGLGFELTFRLIDKVDKKSNNETKRSPPTWPANLLQSLARYCFQTGNRLLPGDNVPWRRPLDGSSNSKITQLLITEDPQLPRAQTPFGWVEFCQIVGVTGEELEQASRWNGIGIINLLKKDPLTGGDWLITDMDRVQSIFELNPDALIRLQENLEKEGSDLAGINADFTFKEIQSPDKIKIKEEIFDSENLNEKYVKNNIDRNDSNASSDNENISNDKDTNELSKNSKHVHCIPPPSSSIATGHSFGYNHFFNTMSLTNNSLQKSYSVNLKSFTTSDVISLDGIEIILAPYAAKFLLLAIKDRVRHGRHFTFKAQNLALTFVAESVTGAAVNKEFPYGVIGYWIQILIPDDLISRMLEDFRKNSITMDTELNERKEFEWADKNLRIIIDNPSVDLFRNMRINA